MEIKFDVYFKKNLGTLCKDNEVDLDGKEAYINLDLSLVDRLEVNYSVGGTKYTDEVTIKDIDNKEILIPFKSDVVKKGLNEFEVVAYMKNGDVKVSQTYTYNIEKSIGEGRQASDGGSSNGHTHNNLTVLNSITQTKVNEWNNKADATHTHNVSEIEGLDNINIDLSNYYTKSETDEAVNNKADKVHTHSEYLTEHQDISHKADKVDTYTKIETDNKISEEISKAQLGGGSEIDLSAYATKNYVDDEISKIELKEGPQGPKGDKGDVGPQGPQGPAGTFDSSNFYNKTEVNEIVNELKGNQSNSSAIVKDIFANNELPRIYMTSDKLGLLASKSDPEAMCGCEIKINNKTIKCYATGKVQGTTSATFPAKNFTFKFYSDKECLNKQKIDVGWGEQYKYCFKKNWVDTTHTRNLAGARIAYDMVESRPDSNFKTYLQTAPRNGVVDGFPCKLYINGEFWGLYTWNIPKDEWMFNMDSDNPKHMVLCAERNNDGNMNVVYSTQFRKLWDGNDGAEWSIEVGNFSDELKNSFNNAINFVMTASDAEFKNNISNYFDLYSLFDYYIFSYFTCHYDGLGKNMLIGTYDGVHWGAMLYDMDSIFGATYNGASFMEADRPCPAGYQENNSLLWQRIEKCFNKELYARYVELRKGALSLGNVVTHVEEIYDLIPDRVFDEEKAKWIELPSINTNTITRFRNYMRDRAIYVDGKFEEFNIEKVYCTGVSLSSNILSFTDDTPKTLIATVTPSNTTDKVLWNVSPSDIVSVSDGVVTPVKNGECVVTVVCGNYSDTCNIDVQGLDESPITVSNIVSDFNLTLDGNSDIQIPVWNNWANSNIIPIEFIVGSSAEYPVKGNFYCDVLTNQALYNVDNVYSNNGTFECIGSSIYDGSRLIQFGLSKERVGGSNLEDVKAYLRQNPIKLHLYPSSCTIDGGIVEHSVVTGKINLSDGSLEEGNDNVTEKIFFNGDKFYVEEATWLRVFIYGLDDKLIATQDTQTSKSSKLFVRNIKDASYFRVQYYQATGEKLKIARVVF